MSEWKAKRFWKAATPVETEGGFTVQLDGRAVKTPAKTPLVVPSRAMAAAIAAEELEARHALEAQHNAEDTAHAGGHAEDGDDPMVAGAAAAKTSIIPTVSTVGATVRVTFPFERDTAAAVFRRGDVVWMVFDTSVAIEQF